MELNTTRMPILKSNSLKEIIDYYKEAVSFYLNDHIMCKIWHENPRLWSQMA
jgi:hypothetical protein